MLDNLQEWAPCCSVVPVGLVEKTMDVSYVDILKMVIIRYLDFDATGKLL